MVKLGDITASAVLRSIRPTENVTVEKVGWHGSDVVELIYENASRTPGTQLLSRDMEGSLELVEAGRP